MEHYFAHLRVKKRCVKMLFDMCQMSLLTNQDLINMLNHVTRNHLSKHFFHTYYTLTRVSYVTAIQRVQMI